METGSTSLENLTQTVRPLPPRDMVEYIAAAETLQKLPDGILKTLLCDGLVDEVSLKRNNSAMISQSQPQKKYTIVKVRAKMLGYSEKKIGDGSRLGRFVHERIKPAFQEMIGRYPVYHYQISPELDTTIHTFLGAN
jgi:hypothetical protein